MIAVLVYALCAMTSIFCVILLTINYRQSGVKLLFWTALCFLGLAVNNILLFVDLSLVLDRDLSLYRILPAVLGVSVLLWGLVWESI